MVGYKNRQSIAKIFDADHYLSPSQAVRFKAAFGYSIDYLIEGKGHLRSVNNFTPSDTLNFKMSLMVLATQNEGDFGYAFYSYYGAMVELFGPEGVPEILQSCSRLVNIMHDRDPEAKEKAAEFFKGWKDVITADDEDYRKFLDLEKSQVLRHIYDLMSFYGEYGDMKYMNRK